jgi:gas vesicle protein
MPMNDANRKMFTGFLIGAGVGAALALLLEPRLRAYLRNVLTEGAGDVAAGVGVLRHGPDSWKNRKTVRFQKRIDRMRSAGF